jgi:histone H3/H4
MSEIVVKAKIKELARIDEKQLNVSSDFYEEINKTVKEIIIKACNRAKANGRNTIMDRDV